LKIVQRILLFVNIYVYLVDNGSSLKEPTVCDSSVELESHVECLDVFSLNAAADAGEFQNRMNLQLEKSLSENDIGVRAFSARSTHSRFFSLGTGQQAIDVRKINNEADIATITATQIVQR
jgi:hypothetical protein